MNVSDEANDAMWTAMETNTSDDWDKAIELAKEADEADRQG